MQLRNHYCPAPVCAPSRASLLLGVHQGHANVRDNQFDKALENNHTLATRAEGGGLRDRARSASGACKAGPPEKSPEAAKASPADWPGYPDEARVRLLLRLRAPRGWALALPKGRRPAGLGKRSRNLRRSRRLLHDRSLHRAGEKVDHRPARRAAEAAVLSLPRLRHAAREAAASARRNSPRATARAAALQWLGKPGAMINTAGGKPDSYMHPDYAQRDCGITTTTPRRRSSRGRMFTSALRPTCGASTTAWATCWRCCAT